MADFFVRIDELADYATAFWGMTASSEHQLNLVMAGLSAVSDCWGDDAAGAAFFAAYDHPATDTLSCAMQMPSQLMTLAIAMAQTQQAYSGTEATNTTLSGGVNA